MVKHSGLADSSVAQVGGIVLVPLVVEKILETGRKGMGQCNNKCGIYICDLEVRRKI